MPHVPKFESHFADLGPSLSTPNHPEGMIDPILISAHRATESHMGLEPGWSDQEASIALLSGNATPEGAKPLSMVYSGHQFGQYVNQLGDGRGILLGELSTPNGMLDVHLKGAGTSPYSRFGDGRAVLRSCVREYLASIAMAGLGIPTTRALAIVANAEVVQREQPEPRAMLTRVARTHIRFGSFEYFYNTQQHASLRQLADYTVAQLLPNACEDEDRYEQLFAHAVTSTAHMIADWQGVGFAHGVMNTDNMSMAGETFDYGPFGFMEAYEPGYICNHSDHMGRYAFNMQPGIAYWNLQILANTFATLVPMPTLSHWLDQFESLLIGRFTGIMLKKFGLSQSNKDINTMISSAFGLMESHQLDYTNFFRLLSESLSSDGEEAFLNMPLYEENSATNPKQHDETLAAIDSWFRQYRQVVSASNRDKSPDYAMMQQTNPKYILRNYLAQQAIDQIQKDGTTGLLEQLISVLDAPFTQHEQTGHLQDLPPTWGRNMALSCSS